MFKKELALTFVLSDNFCFQTLKEMSDLCLIKLSCAFQRCLEAPVGCNGIK